MKHHSRYLALFAALTGICSLSTVAHADFSASTQSFHPALGPENLFTVEGTRTPNGLMFMGSLGIDWAYRPLRILDTTDNFLVAETLHDMVTLHPMLGLGITRWFSIGIEIPVVLYQNFNPDGTTDVNFLVTPSSAGVGDLRLITKFRIINNQDGGIGFAFIPEITFPTANSNELRGIGAVGFDIKFALDYKFKIGAFIALNLGFLAKTADSRYGDSVLDSHEIRYALGAYVPLGKAEIGKSIVGAILEFTGTTSVVNNSDNLYSPFEMNAGIRYNHRSGFVLGAGVGLGLAPVAGSPQLRLFANIGYEKVKQPPKPVPKPTEQPVEAPPPPPPAPPAPQPQVEEPPLDSDKDGIPDKDDKCPFEPGPKENAGCPAPRHKIVVTQNEIQLLEQVHFATDKATILPDSFDLLNEVVSALTNRDTMEVLVGGHTDIQGETLKNGKPNLRGQKHNRELSQRRADAVRNYLINKGIKAERMNPQGYGSSVPATTDKAKQLHAQMDILNVELDGLKAKLKATKNVKEKTAIRKQIADDRKQMGTLQKQINDGDRRTEFIITHQ